MSKKTDKEYLKSRVEKLPDDVTMDEGMARLIFLYNTEKSVADKDQKFTPVEEVEAAFKARWETKKERV
jgi:hypothetical protein